jgi:hypothetical protein
MFLPPSGVCGVSLQLFLLELVNFGDLARVGGTLTEQKVRVEYIIEDSCAPVAPSNDGKLAKYKSYVEVIK